MLPILKQALGIFRTNTPEGVRVPTSDGAEYALYSFAPDLHVINGFLQALIGLYDLAKYGGDADAQALYAEGERVARREVPNYDTGAWSLYSRGSSEHESDLSYHQLADLVPAQPVHAHPGARVLRHRAEVHPVRDGGAGDLAAPPRRCAAASSAR